MPRAAAKAPKMDPLFNLHKAPLGQVLNNLAKNPPKGVDPRTQALADLTFVASAKAMIPSVK